jgi:hypothetical protein
MDARRAARDEAEFQRRAQTLRSPTRRDEVATAHERLHNDALDRQYGFQNLERSLYRRSGSAGGGSNTSPKR